MRKLMASAGLALAVGLGSLTAGIPAAQAQGFDIQIGPDGIRPVIRDNDRNRNNDRYERRDGCSPRDARAAARDEGFRNVQVVRVTDRSITIEGDTRNGVDTIRFANRPGCPEI